MRKSRNYWTKERCQEEALKYIRISDFKRMSGGAYISAYHNGWLNEIRKHIVSKIKPVGYWTIENCRIEALKYVSRTEFKIKAEGAYDACKENKWIDDVCKHMIRIGNRYNKCVYVFEFPDKSAYVGITYNIERRKHDRDKCESDSVTKYIRKSGLAPLFKQLTDYINVDNAVELEFKYVNEYKNNGWKILNQSKTGSVGSVKKWTKEKCIEIAKKCKTRTDFCRHSKGAYDAARRYDWINEIYMLVQL